LAVLLSRNTEPGNCTVTLCHSRTRNLSEHTRQADLLIAAAGVPELVGADDVKPGAVVIDVGIHRKPDATRPNGYRLVGDVRQPEVAEVARALSPVPGGVGPMTIAALLQNTLQAYQQQTSLSQPIA
jgi:methylenetetrahydrofolate dehydrogenase (NADP+)/methenyltetrahydrofolate cyclohydrolase